MKTLINLYIVYACLYSCNVEDTQDENVILTALILIITALAIKANEKQVITAVTKFFQDEQSKKI
ncbi:hypothetical protein [Riemerella columbina]|uniref:hypothetical protein n=1 Tax=Riemerella columbina TaxID=103810 RepID=UPI000369126A|nr:hypothetical protein [Riemerella columbina]